MTDEIDLTKLIARNLGISEKDQKEFDKSVQAWDRDFKRFEDAVRESAVVTEKDLSIRINVRDNE